MTDTIEETNKTLVLEAFDTLFNKRDYEAAARYWSPKYIQHSAHIAPGRDGLFELIRRAPASLRYEHGVILADKEFVIVHDRLRPADLASVLPPGSEHLDARCPRRLASDGSAALVPARR